MPNEALINELDVRRDTYTQKAKAAATLQAAFKTVTNTHNKAQKALRDFSGQNTGIDVENAPQAASEQCRATEEDDGQRDFYAHEHRSRAGLRSCAGGAAAQQIDRTPPSCPQRRDEAEQHGHQCRDRDAEDGE